MDTKRRFRIGYILIIAIAGILFNYNLYGEKKVGKPEYKITNSRLW